MIRARLLHRRGEQWTTEGGRAQKTFLTSQQKNIDGEILHLYIVGQKGGNSAMAKKTAKKSSKKTTKKTTKKSKK
jgi:hypothetical protein